MHENDAPRRDPPRPHGSAVLAVAIDHVLMINPSDLGRSLVENGVRRLQIQCLAASWENLEQANANSRRRLAVVWPARHQARPALPPRALAELVQRTPVIAMLRPTDYELLAQYHHANLWVFREDGRPENLERMLGFLLAQVGG